MMTSNKAWLFIIYILTYLWLMLFVWYSPDPVLWWSQNIDVKSEFLFSIEHILFWVWHKRYLLIMWRTAGGVLRYLRMFLFKEKLPISGYLADTHAPCAQMREQVRGDASTLKNCSQITAAIRIIQGWFEPQQKTFLITGIML